MHKSGLQQPFSLPFRYVLDDGIGIVPIPIS